MYMDYLFYLKDHKSVVIKTYFKNDEEAKSNFIMWVESFGYTKEQVGILMNIGYAYYSTDLELPTPPELVINIS